MADDVATSSHWYRYSQLASSARPALLELGQLPGPPPEQVLPVRAGRPFVELLDLGLEVLGSAAAASAVVAHLPLVRRRSPRRPRSGGSGRWTRIFSTGKMAERFRLQRAATTTRRRTDRTSRDRYGQEYFRCAEEVAHAHRPLRGRAVGSSRHGGTAVITRNRNGARTSRVRPAVALSLAVMDTNLLRSWLGLPPGPWPPDDPRCWALPAGPVDPADAERRALDADGPAPPAPTPPPGSGHRGDEPARPGAPGRDRARLRPAAIGPGRPDAPAGRDRLQARTAAGRRGDPRTRASRPGVLEPAADDADRSEESPPLPVPSAMSPALAGQRPTRRQFPSPSRPIPSGRGRSDRRRPTANWPACGLLRAGIDCGSHLADPSAGVTDTGACVRVPGGRPGVRAAAITRVSTPERSAMSPRRSRLVRVPLPLAVFRSLGPAQRQALARDWAAGRSKLVTRSARCASGVAAGHSDPADRAPRPGWCMRCPATPEWVLIAAVDSCSPRWRSVGYALTREASVEKPAKFLTLLFANLRLEPWSGCSPGARKPPGGWLT